MAVDYRIAVGAVQQEWERMQRCKRAGIPSVFLMPLPESIPRKFYDDFDRAKDVANRMVDDVERFEVRREARHVG